MNKNKVAFSTTVFPMPDNYLEDFFSSLDMQTNKQFDLVILNDGFRELESYKKRYSNLNIVELKYSGTPAENRTFALKYIIENGYDMIIFGDSDDTFGTNRVEECVTLLGSCDVVVNDLTLFDINGAISEKYLSNRINHLDVIDVKFIHEKNIFGLSNTALRTSVLSQVNLNFNPSLVAVDWYLFTSILLQDYIAVYTANTLTYYRQYELNTIGMGDITHLAKTLSVKEHHYREFCHCAPEFQELLDNTLKAKSLLQFDSFDELNANNIKYPFWWEY